VDPRYESSEWHDVDRIGDSHLVVADMYSDEVFILNLTSGMVVWEWSVQGHQPLHAGGPYPEDWTHLNDVEVLEDGRIMVSLRNMDQVVFLDRQRGVIEDWTLGSEDAHRILYEQHNPDYISAEFGGPAVVIAGSENNRVVEYKRTPNGTWNRTWLWKDSRLQWPRDADRLPNGHTLITDTHGGRVIEVDEDGEIVWQLDVPVAYEAERLETGDESAGGPSASRAGIPSVTAESESNEKDSSPIVRIKSWIKGRFPNKLVNGITAVTPVWVGLFDLVVLLFGLFSFVLWIGLETWWAPYSLRNPVKRRET